MKGDSRPAAKRGWPLQADFAVIAVLVLLVGAAAGALVLLIEKPFTEPVLLDGVEHALHAERVAAARA